MRIKISVMCVFSLPLCRREKINRVPGGYVVHTVKAKAEW